MKSDEGRKTLASERGDFKKVANSSIFECEEDGSLTFKFYCENGVSGSIPNTQCL